MISANEDIERSQANRQANPTGKENTDNTRNRKYWFGPTGMTGTLDEKCSRSNSQSRGIVQVNKASHIHTAKCIKIHGVYTSSARRKVVP